MILMRQLIPMNKEKNTKIKYTTYRLLLNNNNGVAVIMIMGAITFLTILLVNFSFETRINRLKSFNLQDQAQAKLNAESGLKLAMAKLRLYKDARNILEKNKGLQNIMSRYKLEAIVTSPFMFPIPISDDANIIQKEAVKDFSENILLLGEMSVSITALEGFLNPNNLRITKKTVTNNENDNKKDNSSLKYIEKKFVDLLTKQIQNKIEDDPEFEYIYGNTDPEFLIKELKYFVNDKDKLEDDYYSIEELYTTANVIPKHAPLTSLSELYLLEGWTDDLITLIKDHLTVHSVSIIQINNINDDTLKFIFPDITEEQIKNFFKYRDGTQGQEQSPEDEVEPHPFQNSTDFKDAVVNKLDIVDDSTYQNIITEFAKADLHLGVAGKIFKVLSEGKHNNSSYSIQAIIDLPIKPVKKKKKKNKKKKKKPTLKYPLNTNNDNNTQPQKEDPKKEPPPPLELLDPRVIELKIM